MLGAYYVLGLFKVSRAPRDGITRVAFLLLNDFFFIIEAVFQDLCRQEAILGMWTVIVFKRKQYALTLHLKRER